MVSATLVRKEKHASINENLKVSIFTYTTVVRTYIYKPKKSDKGILTKDIHSHT